MALRRQGQLPTSNNIEEKYRFFAKPFLLSISLFKKVKKQSNIRIKILFVLFLMIFTRFQMFLDTLSKSQSSIGNNKSVTRS